MRNCATSAKKVLAENLKQRSFKEKKIVDDANKIAKSIKALEIKIPAKVGSGDKLFGSVNNSDVSAALEKAGQKIEKKFITVIVIVGLLSQRVSSRSKVIILILLIIFSSWMCLIIDLNEMLII